MHRRPSLSEVLLQVIMMGGYQGDFFPWLCIASNLAVKRVSSTVLHDQVWDCAQDGNLQQRGKPVCWTMFFFLNYGLGIAPQLAIGISSFVAKFGAFLSFSAACCGARNLLAFASCYLATCSKVMNRMHQDATEQTRRWRYSRSLLKVVFHFMCS